MKKNVTLDQIKLLYASIMRKVKEIGSIGKAGSGNKSVILNNDNNTASGEFSFASGNNTTASGVDSHTEGRLTQATGTCSHAEGMESKATNSSTHAEGYNCTASGDCAHAEGHSSIASGDYSHAEGGSTKAEGYYSHAEGVNTTAKGDYSHVEGYQTTAGIKAHAEGENTQASGAWSHAEGQGASAGGEASHAEGYYTRARGTGDHAEGMSSYAFGQGCHAEGGGTQAFNSYSHAEGYNTISNGFGAHAEGGETTASGDYSHAEGKGTAAKGIYSHVEGYSTSVTNAAAHAEGYETRAEGLGSHAEGQRTTASGQDSHSEGYFTHAEGDYSHAEGRGTTAEGGYSHVEGYGTHATNSAAHAEGSSTHASGVNSHAEGDNTSASGASSHAEGAGTTASASHSHAEGYHTTASGLGSHAEGYYTIASNYCSHAEGEYTTASGKDSHAEGNFSHAQGDYSHVEGCYTIASGKYSHAEGHYSQAEGYYSHTEGYYTIASSDCSHTQGKFNIKDTEKKYAHIVGNGSSEQRSNAHTLDWDGNAEFAGDVIINGCGGESPISLKNAFEDSLNIISKPNIYSQTMIANSNYSSAKWYNISSEIHSILRNQTYSSLYLENPAIGSYKANFVFAGTNMGGEYMFNTEMIDGTDYQLRVPYSPQIAINITGVDYSIEKEVVLYIDMGETIIKLPMLKETAIPDNIPKIQSAEVGQMLAVKAVDENGKPTEWEVMNFAGGPSKELIIELKEEDLYEFSGQPVFDTETVVLSVDEGIFWRSNNPINSFFDGEFPCDNGDYVYNVSINGGPFKTCKSEIGEEMPYIPYDENIVIILQPDYIAVHQDLFTEAPTITITVANKFLDNFITIPLEEKHIDNNFYIEICVKDYREDFFTYWDSDNSYYKSSIERDKNMLSKTFLIEFYSNLMGNINLVFGFVKNYNFDEPAEQGDFTGAIMVLGGLHNCQVEYMRIYSINKK